MYFALRCKNVSYYQTGNTLIKKFSIISYSNAQKFKFCSLYKVMWSANIQLEKMTRKHTTMIAETF